jgi:hypothetical protein
VLEPVLEQELALERELVLELALERELVLAREQALAWEQAMEPRRQPGSQLAVMPAELAIFSFSSRNPPPRFCSA